MAVSPNQRFTPANPCPVCGGHERAPRGKGDRCFGFLSEDGNFAHCTRAEFAGELALNPESETYPHRLHGPCRCGSTHGEAPAQLQTRRQIETTYDYVDEDGNLLSQVVRHSPKGFSQRRPDGNGGWIWGLNRTRRVLYNLTEVIKSSYIFVVEGEKDCESIKEFHWVATTNPGGAGKWRDEYAKYFHGKNVVILPDADDPGHQHALDVARSLVGTCSTLRVVELPNAKDVSEWIRNGGTQQALHDLVKGAPPLDATALERLRRKWFPNEPDAKSKASTEFSLLDLPSVWRLTHNLEWLVENLLAIGSVNLLSAESDTGKTWLAYFIAWAVAFGVSILGRKVEKRKVLYVDGENPLFVVKQRLHDLGAQETEDLVVWGGWNDPPPAGPNHPALQRFAKEHKPLIIFDSLIEFHPGSEQSSSETRTFMRGFRELANLGATVLILHHTGKASTAQLYRGSSDIKASVDMAYHLKKVSENSSGLNELSITCFKGRLMPVQSFSLKFERGKGFVLAESSVVGSVRSDAEIIEEIVGANGGLNQRQIVELAKRQGVAKHRAAELLRTGPFQTEKGKGSEILYYIDDDASPQQSAQNPGFPTPRPWDSGNPAQPTQNT